MSGLSVKTPSTPRRKNCRISALARSVLTSLSVKFSVNQPV